MKKTKKPAAKHPQRRSREPNQDDAEAFLGFARRNDKPGFLKLAAALGIPADKHDALWSGIRRLLATQEGTDQHPQAGVGSAGSTDITNLNFHVVGTGATAAAEQSRPRRRLINLRIDAIKLVGPAGEVTLSQRRRGRGRPRSISLKDFQADVTAHPTDSIRRRATRLGISRRTVNRLSLSREVRVEMRGGPVVLIK